MSSAKTTSLGFGVGLRPSHYAEFFAKKPHVDWIEIISENFMGVGGKPRAVLEKVRNDFPIGAHGVSLAIGSVDSLNESYLHELHEFVRWLEPAIVSDHLCWGGYHGNYAHDLLPLPFTEEALTHVVTRVSRVQDKLQRKILLENVSSYVSYTHSTLSEWDFLSEVARRTDCGILLDINNIYVSARNHNFDALEYLLHVPPEHVLQFHLAGHRDEGAYLFDAHDRRVCEDVWGLYRTAVERFKNVPTLIEWDENVPPLDELIAECEKARAQASLVPQKEPLLPATL